MTAGRYYAQQWELEPGELEGAPMTVIVERRALLLMVDAASAGEVGWSLTLPKMVAR
jgi:hypothetical protein